MSVPSRFCPNCGKPVVAEAKFCPSCGATIPTAQAIPPIPAQPQTPPTPAYPSYGPSYQTPYQQPYQQAPKKSNTKIIIAVVVIIIIVVGAIGAIAAYTFINTLPTQFSQKSLSIASGNYPVSAGHYYYFTFSLPVTATLITVNGTFNTAGRIQTLVMDSSNFAGYQSSGSANYLYNSGSTTSGTILANLPSAGTYDLVYANTYGYNETFTTTATVYYR